MVNANPNVVLGKTFMDASKVKIVISYTNKENVLARCVLVQLMLKNLMVFKRRLWRFNVTFTTIDAAQITNRLQTDTTWAIHKQWIIVTAVSTSFGHAWKAWCTSATVSLMVVVIFSCKWVINQDSNERKIWNTSSLRKDDDVNKSDTI